MIDPVSGARAATWSQIDQTPRTAERPAISVYQAPSERRVATDGLTATTDRLLMSLTNAALRLQAKEVLEAGPAAAPAPTITSMSSRSQIAVAASATFRSEAPEYQVSVARLVQSAEAPPPAETEEPPPAETAEPPTTGETTGGETTGGTSDSGSTGNTTGETSSGSGGLLGGIFGNR